MDSLTKIDTEAQFFPILLCFKSSLAKTLTLISPMLISGLENYSIIQCLGFSLYNDIPYTWVNANPLICKCNAFASVKSSSRRRVSTPHHKTPFLPLELNELLRTMKESRLALICYLRSNLAGSVQKHCFLLPITPSAFIIHIFGESIASETFYPSSLIAVESLKSCSIDSNWISSLKIQKITGSETSHPLNKYISELNEHLSSPKSADDVLESLREAIKKPYSSLPDSLKNALESLKNFNVDQSVLAKFIEDELLSSRIEITKKTFKNIDDHRNFLLTQVLLRFFMIKFRDSKAHFSRTLRTDIVALYGSYSISFDGDGTVDRDFLDHVLYPLFFDSFPACIEFIYSSHELKLPGEDNSLSEAEDEYIIPNPSIAPVSRTKRTHSKSIPQFNRSNLSHFSSGLHNTNRLFNKGVLKYSKHSKSKRPAKSLSNQLVFESPPIKKNSSHHRIIHESPSRLRRNLIFE